MYWRSIPRALVVFIVACAFSAGLSAHHSFAVFDHTQSVTVTGPVTKFQWSNPHGFLEVDYVGAGGKMKHYTLELTSINMLQRMRLESQQKP